MAFLAQALEALHRHQPLPTGPYPTARWPEGCTHLPKPTDPTPDCIVHVEALGAKWVVGVLKDGPHEAAEYQFGTLPALPARDLLDRVKLGGKWFDASEAVPNFVDDIQQALDAMGRNS